MCSGRPNSRPNACCGLLVVLPPSARQLALDLEPVELDSAGGCEVDVHGDCCHEDSGGDQHSRRLAGNGGSDGFVVVRDGFDDAGELVEYEIRG